VGHESRLVGWRRRLRGDSGQAFVEAALVIPVLLLLAFGVVMAGRVSHAKIAVQAAAREASRTLATASSEQAGIADAFATARSVAQGYDLSQDRLTVDVESNGFQRGGTASAEVTYQVPLADLPLLNRLEVAVSSSHSERIDLYRSREAVLR
jgi:Flp pilus assembly protein TadG